MDKYTMSLELGPSAYLRTYALHKMVNIHTGSRSLEGLAFVSGYNHFKYENDEYCVYPHYHIFNLYWV